MSAASASDHDISEDTVIARKRYFKLSKENLKEHWKFVSDESEENRISTKLYKKVVNWGQMVRAESMMRGVSIYTFLDFDRKYDKYFSEIKENCKELNFDIHDQKAGY